MEGRVTYHHYNIQEFYNKILKNNNISDCFPSKAWNIHTKVAYLNYVKRGFPSKPIIFLKDENTYRCIDGNNRIGVIMDLMLGGFDSYFIDDVIKNIQNMEFDVYITYPTSNMDDLIILRNVFHGDDFVMPPPVAPQPVTENDVKIITHEKKITITQKTKIPKKQIAEALKTSVWNKYIGLEQGSAPCYCCQTTRITQREFDTGHVIAEISGGKTHIDNLRPICRKCNLSMGAMNMELFRKQFTS